MSHTPFAQEFKNLRLAANLTQDAAAKRFGVSIRAIAYWEANERLPSEDEQQAMIVTMRAITEPAQQTAQSPEPAQLQPAQSNMNSPKPAQPAQPVQVIEPEKPRFDPTRKGITDSPRATTLAAEWAKRSNIYPPNPLPYGLSPSELLEAHSRGEPGLTITQRRHAQQWLDILTPRTP